MNVVEAFAQGAGLPADIFQITFGSFTGGIYLIWVVWALKGFYKLSATGRIQHSDLGAAGLRLTSIALFVGYLIAP